MHLYVWHDYYISKIYSCSLSHIHISFLTINAQNWSKNRRIHCTPRNCVHLKCSRLWLHAVGAFCLDATLLHLALWLSSSLMWGGFGPCPAKLTPPIRMLRTESLRLQIVSLKSTWCDHLDTDFWKTMLGEQLHSELASESVSIGFAAGGRFVSRWGSPKVVVVDLVEGRWLACTYLLAPRVTCTRSLSNLLTHIRKHIIRNGTKCVLNDSVCN